VNCDACFHVFVYVTGKEWLILLSMLPLDYISISFI